MLGPARQTDALRQVLLFQFQSNGIEFGVGQAGQLSVWQLATSGAGWQRVQVIKVQIPYGSSS